MCTRRFSVFHAPGTRLDLDFLCAARTALYHSWRNPAERIMSIINLGLQCVGIMRKEMTPETEASIPSCNNMAQLRKVGESKLDLVQAVQDLSLSRFYSLRLKLKTSLSRCSQLPLSPT